MLSPAATAPKLKLAIYRSSSIGDVVLATALIDMLKHLAIPAEIYWIGRQPSLGLLAASFPWLECIEIKSADQRSEQLETVERLPHLHFIIDLQKSLRSHFICRHLAKKHQAPVYAWEKSTLRRTQLVLKARWRGRSRPLDEIVLVAPKKQYQSMCDSLRKALRENFPAERLLGLDTYDAIPQLPLQLSANEMSSSWTKELQFGNWFAVGPGAAHPTKQAPLPVLKSILDCLSDRLKNKHGLLFVGDENDRRTANLLLNDLNWSGPVLNLAGKLSLAETATALGCVHILLSNDSSLAHIAEAVNTPVAVLFGPTVEGFGFAPRMPQSKAFSSLLGCRPCSKHGKVPCRFNDQACFSGIDQQQVAGHIHSILESDQCPK